MQRGLSIAETCVLYPMNHPGRIISVVWPIKVVSGLKAITTTRAHDLMGTRLECLVLTSANSTRGLNLLEQTRYTEMINININET